MKYQRIEDMRIDQDLTIKEISALLECNRDVYSRYEKGIRDIPIDFVIRLALPRFGMPEPSDSSVLRRTPGT